MCVVQGSEAITTADNNSSLYLLNFPDALGLVLSALCELCIDLS